MTKFKFEIQNCIMVEVEADNQRDARIKVIYALEDGEYNEQMISDCSVSDGKEVKE